MLQYQQTLDEGSLDPSTTILAICPSPNFYGGATELLYQCQIRQFCGMTHFIALFNQCQISHPEKKKIDLYDKNHAQMMISHAKSKFKQIEIITPKPVAFNKYTKEAEYVTLPAPGEYLPAYLDLYDDEIIREMAMKGWRCPDALPTSIMSIESWKILVKFYVNI